MFKKILIANRGEIACRVIRTARAMGIKTVAVYSEADADALHVREADEAVAIGPSAAAESYLKIDKIIEACRQTGADAVHPGYGFLSERADFAQACAEAGLVFIGPPPAAIRAMGDKAAAKRRMREAGVPCAPGYLGEDQSDDTLTRQAHELGVPLLVKAVAGGGGRGMRLVHDVAELQPALAGARREALSAFGDGTLMLERLIEGGRHIEIQVFADAQGHCIHLGERDCTAQRRRQKVIEEAPSPVVSATMRERMGADAVAAALAVGYQGAGTVEFIVDAQLNHFFLEMNTRLQVEHPVTECITGLDLVEWQLRIAAGEALPLTQDQLRLHGHAIEVRLYAEDPYAGFTPQTGAVLHWRPDDALRGRGAGAAMAGGVRIDAGIAEGGSISPHYDAMVAKVVAHGRDRTDAIRRLRAALREAVLVGPKNNGRFLLDLLDSAAFRDAAMTTGLLDQWAAGGHALLQRPQPGATDWAVAAAALALRGQSSTADASSGIRNRTSTNTNTSTSIGNGTRNDNGGTRPASVAAWDMTLLCDDQRQTLRVHAQGHSVRVAAVATPSTAPSTAPSAAPSPAPSPAQPPAPSAAPATAHAHAHRIELLSWADHHLRYAVDGVQHQAIAVPTADGLQLVRDAVVFRFSEASPYPAVADARDPRRACAPVAGTVAAVSVQVGDVVAEGQPLVCVEAMKMEMWLQAAATGRVTAVHVQPRDAVEAGTVLVELELPPRET